MKTIKLSQYGIVISPDKVNAIHEEMRAGVGEPITLDFKDVKGIDSAAAHELLKSMRGHKGALVQMKNASPMVKSVMMYSSGATVSSGKSRKRFLGLIMLAAMLMLGVGQMWAVKSTFTKGETIFIYREGDNSAWRDDACVKAYFNDGNGSGSAEYTNWLCNSTSNAKYQVYYTIVPSTGYDRVQIERWPTACTGSKWNDEWTSLQSNRGSDDYNVLFSETYDNKGWKNETFNFALKTDVNSWGDAVATFEDKGDGLFQCTYTFTASAASHNFKVLDCWGHWYGRQSDGNNYALNGLTNGISYTVVASFYIQDCDANNGKTSLSVITIHEPGVYTSASGYNKTLKSWANGLYEWYGVYNGGDSDMRILASASTSNTTGVAVFSKATISATQWLAAKIGGRTNTSGTTACEFSGMGNNAIQVKATTDYFELCVQGYDSLRLAAKDASNNSGQNKYIQVKINGVERTSDNSLSSSASIRKYKLDPTTPQYIRIHGSSADGGTIWGFSLRPAAPSITASSLSGATYDQGAAAAALSVTVSPVVAGHTPTYQWYSNTTDKNTGGTIIGEATSASYTPSTTSTGTTYYYCVVSEEGCNSKTSDVSGAITVNEVVVPCSAPTLPNISGTTAYTAGNTISLTASATGTSGSTTYTWYKGTTWDAASAEDPVQAESTSGATYTKASCVVGDAGTYWCNISNGTGCEVQVSKAITVSAAPTVGTFSPASGSTVKSGTTVTVTGSTGSTVYYQWSSSSSAPTAATIVSSGTAGTSGAATVTTSGISSSATYLYVVASNGGVNSAVSSASYTIDDTAPTLSSSVPANSATNVNTSGTIVLTFSEAIASVDETKFTLTNATKDAVTIDGSDNTKVNITYSEASNSTTVTLATAAGAVTDAVGNSSAALSSISFTTKAAATLTAISAGVVYDADEIIPYGQTISTTEDVIFNDASYSSGNLFYTSTLASNGPKANAKPGDIPNVTIGEGEVYEATFEENMMFIKGAATLSGTPKKPSAPSIKFKIPAGGGTLYLYGPSNTTAKFIKEGDTDGTAIANSNKYISVSVSGGDICYIYGSSTSTSGFYGLKLVATVPCTAAPTVTAGSNSSVTSTTATVSCAGGISSLGTGGCTITSYGFVIGTATDPTIGGSGVTRHEVGTSYASTGTPFSKDLTGLTALTTYYVRPYATNGYGTAYGTQTSFTTTAAPTTYTVTFNSNGGSSVSPIEQASAGASIAKPSDPTRASYEFDGWYTTAGEKISWSYTPTADITLYARWEEECDEEGVAKSTTDVAATGYTAYQEVGGSNVVFTSAPSLGFKYKDADGEAIDGSTTEKTHNNAYQCEIKGSGTNIGSVKTTNPYSNVDSISFYFAGSNKANCKVAVWCSTDNFSTDSTSLLSATAIANGVGAGQFVRKVIAIPSDKKASALRFKFRFTVSSTGQKCYIDSLKVYSSTTGGSTCYHVYYHGNGAESGYVNDTVSYTAGSKATVLNYNYGRYPLAKAGNDFQGWATSADGAVVYTAGQKIDITTADVDLYAKWATASSALVTWEKKVNVATWTDNTTPSTTNPTNIGTIGSSATLIASPGATSGKTPQIQLASGVSNADKGASFTFSMKSADKVVVPTKVSCEVANVGSESNGDITYKAVLTDGAGNTYYSTNSICPNNNGTLNPIDFVFSSGLSLRGDITVKVYAWLTGSGSGFSFRMGPDVKFYGTVEDYECATPAAPTISGVSEYVPGQDITLTASHDGENYDNLTTYTWYKGTDWATASAASPVQAAATGSSGYTLTIDDCTTGNAGLYWCKVSNGTGCDAHNSEGYDVTVYPTYTITYNLNGGDWGEVVHKDSYTQFDEDYTLPTPTKTGSVFAGWYGASDFSGLPTVVLGAGSVGNKEYWAKWGASVTVSWTVTKVDDKLYRGGGDYSVKAVINETDWSTGFMDELELTATEGVTLKNIEVSENGESKVQVTADFDITTDLAADATEITFTLDVPADGTYGPKVDEHEEDLTDCGGGVDTDNSYVIGKSNSDATNISSSAAFRAYKTASDWYSKGNTTFTDKTSTDGFTISATEKSYYWQNNGTFTESSSSNCRLRTIKLAKSNGVTIRWTNDELSFSKVRFIGRNTAADDPTTFTVSNGTTEKTFTFEAGNSEIQTKEVTMDFVSGNTKGIVISGGTKEINILIELIPTSVGGETPTLTWDDDDADIATSGVSKSTSNDDFIYTASQDKNSLGAITYSSSDATVATVNATTGQVHLVGAAGTATITATIAASGCFSSANVSYTITVTDDCDDEAGTIETEDLGCSGIQMTITGHTTTGETVSYQWYKDDVSLGSADGAQTATYTTTAAGEYYVIVTNTGDRHCAKRSTNTITVEAQAAATVTKIVDSWYVKKDRRTPDIELVKTTNATSFTVTNGSTVIWNSDGSNTTGFAGCGFRMDENGIIYLNGTKDGSSGTSDNADAPAHGDETWTAGDVTLTITAIGCGSSASQDITIHKQAATSYYDIAFVADGGKGMKKDSITVGHGDGTELYEYLDSVGTAAGKRWFQLSERNIYWTTDEKAIREEYSQFDAILITDDPSTNTVVKTGDDYKTKGYVNAFGTMVDVRPIFTMEAYVSALKNWGAKGIAGAPESPNPRQYEMRLECKDHEIYGAGLPDPEDGTNVWEETIGGETFRHVIIVDSTKGVYKGVAYNAETAGNKKPALQGFTGEAAGSLLGLGRILEGTLQAAIERQEEPAARLLVMGINAKALQPTCALTNEGKAVIKNILVYLLKTNMEEVDDCSNYFTGGASGTDTDWNKASNWSKNALPSNEAKVRILAPCVVKNGNTFHVAQVDIATSGPSSKKGSGAANGNLTIEAGGALIVAGKIRAAEAPYFAANDLKPTTPEDLIINTDGSAQAALIFDNEEGETQATVNLYSLGRKPSSYQYQYFAVPMEVVPVNPTFANETHGGTGIYTYVYNEATSGWTRRGYYDDLYAFEGLGITTKSATAMEYTMTGTLASTATKEITLTYDGAGLNLIGNSWMAPIQIGALAEDNTDANITKTAYIYCAGRDAVEGAATSGDTETAGQWLAVPFEAASFATWKATGKLSVIPAMQAFEIKVSAEATLTLDYDKVVRGSTNDLNAKLRAPGRRMAANEVTMTNIRVADSKTHTDLSLFEGDRFSEAFDNGWEAEYMNGDGRSAKLYAETETGKMAVVAMYDYEGTVVGFAPGKETEYTFSFMGEDNGYYLNDIKLKNSVRISEGETYTFTFEEGDAANRFYISRQPLGGPAITTGVDEVREETKPRKFIYNDKMYILFNGRVFDATGKAVK